MCFEKVFWKHVFQITFDNSLTGKGMGTVGVGVGGGGLGKQASTSC